MEMISCITKRCLLSPISSCTRLRLVCLAGVPEQAGRVSSGPLRAHVELLEQRLQAPPILRLHPLLSYRGRHEHGVKSGAEERNKMKRLMRSCIRPTVGRRGGGDGGGCSTMKRETGLLAFMLFCTFWVDGAERPLVRFYFHIRTQRQR